MAIMGYSDQDYLEFYRIYVEENSMSWDIGINHVKDILIREKGA
ncbi:hypothetical protein QS257_16385 [Terrilactibacillus sp. S3-3]|nr:hypothetical protein QS257_16385 [Terrilactibacillus sp. S3-3]